MSGARTLREVEGFVSIQLTKILGVPRASIDRDEPLHRYGLGSFQAAALAAALSEELGRSISPTLIWDHPTLEGLCRALVLEQAGDAPGGPLAPERLVGCQWGGFLEAIDQFDPLFFGVSPREASADEVSAIAMRVLRLVFRSRRLLNLEEPCAQEPCLDCYAPHMDKARAFILQQQPILFVLPAFPAKSPNLQKVLGALPDMAEQMALNHLQSVCEQISHVYSPGARIIICSDGRVFSDVVGVRDEDVTAYRRELERLIEGIGGNALDTFALEQVFQDVSYDEMRRMLSERYAAPLEAVRERVRTDAASLALFNGIHRFMFEDQVVLNPGQSRNQVRLRSKDLAYQVIQRSNAWSSLVAERFPQALRLSIHPQPSHSEKIGFHMIRTRDNWLTPWHGVLLDTGEEMMLVKRHEAESLKASLVWRKQRPSHFVEPQVPRLEVLS